MNSIGRFVTRAGAALGAIGVTISLMAVPTDAQPTARPATVGPPAGSVTSAAIDALRVERDLVDQAGRLPQPIPRGLRDRIRVADDAGTQSLAALLGDGYAPSANLLATLGPLPAPSDSAPPDPPSGSAPPRPPPGSDPTRPPTHDAYDAAIRELGGDPGPASPSAPSPTSAAPDGSSATATTALVISVAALAGLVLVVVVLLLRRRKDKQLIAEAMTDSLTGLFNRRRLDNDLHSCSTKMSPVGVLMVDVDNFKAFNDARGHSAGDRVLQQVGIVLAQQVRTKDLVYRYGGEEFCVLLPNAEQSDALIVAERIRAAASRLEIGDSASVTVSVGVALGSGADVMITLDRADAALYDAKREGRDRVSLAACA